MSQTDKLIYSLRAVTGWPHRKAAKAVTMCINHWRDTDFVIYALASGLTYHQALRLEKQKRREIVLAER
jgi:hypothetical protein